MNLKFHILKQSQPQYVLRHAVYKRREPETYSPRQGTRVLLTTAAIVLLTLSLQHAPAPATAAAQVLAHSVVIAPRVVLPAVAPASPLEPPPAASNSRMSTPAITITKECNT